MTAEEAEAEAVAARNACDIKRGEGASHAEMARLYDRVEFWEAEAFRLQLQRVE